MIKINGREIEFKKFPNGETQMMHEAIILEIMGDAIVKPIEITFKYEDDSDLIKLMFVKKYIDEYTLSDVNLNIQYMMYSRMDRSENDSPFTLNYVADFINGLQFDNIIVNEPHSDVTSELLDASEDKFITPIIAEKAMEAIGFTEEDTIMFPDKGAKNRYEKLIVANHIAIGEKTRDFKTGRITGLTLTGDLDGGGYNALIVDDLSSYGGTFVKSAMALREQGFTWVGLVVTHAENVIFDGELFKHVNHVFTTDSILSKQNDWANKKFENQLTIYKMEEL